MKDLIKGELLEPISNKSGWYDISDLKEVQFVRYYSFPSVIIVTITEGTANVSGVKPVGHSVKLFTDVFKRKELIDNYEIY